MATYSLLSTEKTSYPVSLKIIQKSEEWSRAIKPEWQTTKDLETGLTDSDLSYLVSALNITPFTLDKFREVYKESPLSELMSLSELIKPIIIGSLEVILEDLIAEKLFEQHPQISEKVCVKKSKSQPIYVFTHISRDNTETVYSEVFTNLEKAVEALTFQVEEDEHWGEIIAEEKIATTLQHLAADRDMFYKDYIRNKKFETMDIYELVDAMQENFRKADLLGEELIREYHIYKIEEHYPYEPDH